MSVCQLAVILSTLDKVSKGQLIDVNFPQIIPQENVETGSRHRHPHVSYVEYMTFTIEPCQIIGGEHLYLDPVTFRKYHYTRKVHERMDKKLVSINVPCACAFDFRLTYCDARLIDGECKLTTNEEHKSVLIFYFADQLMYK